MGAGHQLGGAPPARRGDQRVVETVDDQQRRSTVAQCVGPVAACEDRRELAGGALGVGRPVVGRGRPSGRRSASKYRLDDQTAKSADRAITSSRSAGGGVSSTCIASGVGSPVRGVADRRHDRRHAEQPVGVLDRQRLDDHPAHRRADDVRLVDAEVVEQADRVSGHVGQRVRHRRQLGASERRRHDRDRIDDATPSSLVDRPSRGCRNGSRTDPRSAKRWQKSLVPGDHLSGEPHDQQQGRVVGEPKVSYSSSIPEGSVALLIARV